MCRGAGSGGSGAGRQWRREAVGGLLQRGGWSKRGAVAGTTEGEPARIHGGGGVRASGEDAGDGEWEAGPEGVGGVGGGGVWRAEIRGTARGEGERAGEDLGRGAEGRAGGAAGSFFSVGWALAASSAGGGTDSARVGDRGGDTGSVHASRVEGVGGAAGRRREGEEIAGDRASGARGTSADVVCAAAAVVFGADGRREPGVSHRCGSAAERGAGWKGAAWGVGSDGGTA